MPIQPENRRRYPANWAEISDRIRFVRGAGRCECTGQCGRDHAGRCTARHDQPHPETGSSVVLTTAHLNHRPEDVREENLLAACQRCHLALDAGHHQVTAAATRAAARAAAGQLAFGDGQQLTRTEPPRIPPPPPAPDPTTSAQLALFAEGKRGPR